MKYKRGINVQINNNQSVTVPSGEIWKVFVFGGCVELRGSSERNPIRVCPNHNNTYKSASGEPYIFPEGTLLKSVETDTQRNPINTILVGLAFTAD